MLPTLISKMIGSDKAWVAIASFCEQVMSQKKAAERIRRQEQAAEEAAEVATEAAADDVASDSGNEADGEEEEYAGEDGGGMVPSLHCPLCLIPPQAIETGKEEGEETHPPREEDEDVGG